MRQTDIAVNYKTNRQSKTKTKKRERDEMDHNIQCIEKVKTTKAAVLTKGNETHIVIKLYLKIVN